jgi:hypothetical protein
MLSVIKLSVAAPKASTIFILLFLSGPVPRMLLLPPEESTPDPTDTVPEETTGYPVEETSTEFWPECVTGETETPPENPTQDPTDPTVPTQDPTS